ncbi:kinase-like domain-containing protein [Irpex rosettiformis]|uniref:Kinase-like domain-containing protein n=1 Tax=Irpex rosettiformis TaxID=378272 RepID=A0ACB8TVC0_9APHY|nr:kinase-like domain-containing protein [Irpex rosettiformis]
MWQDLFVRAHTRLVKVVEKKTTTTTTYYEPVEALEPTERLILCQPNLQGTLDNVFHGYTPYERLSGMACTTALGLRSQLVRDELLSSRIETHFMYLDAMEFQDNFNSDKSTHFAYAGFGPSVPEQVKQDYPYYDDPFDQSIISQSVYPVSHIPTDLPLPPQPVYQLLPPNPPDLPETLESPVYPPNALAPQPAVANDPSHSYDDRQPHIIENNGIRFKITGTLGMGGFARVMKAALLLPAGQEVDVAIKVMHKDQVYHSPDGRKQIMVERRALERVTESGLGGLAKVFCSWDDEENVYFAMPLFPGDLWSVNLELGLASHKIVMKYIAAELVLALANLHSLGIIHCDIKPSNILVDSQGHLSLADFGMAYLSRSSTSVTRLKLRDRSVIGTTVYQAPELVRRSRGENVPYGSAVDIWALGLVIYETVMGCHRPWFDEAMDKDVEARILHGDLRWDIVENYDLELSNLLRCMLFTSAPRRITAESAKYHPYFEGVNWDLLSRGILPGITGGPIFPVPVDPPHHCTSISFSSFHAGRDTRWRYENGDFDGDGILVLPESVYRQRGSDAMEPNAHGYLCPLNCLSQVFPELVNNAPSRP